MAQQDGTGNGGARAPKAINRRVVRDMALGIRRRERPAWKAERVAESLYEAAEAHMRAWLTDRVKRHPSMGKTIT